MIEKAKALVRQYIQEHLEDPNEDYTLFVVWQAAVLQNFKCLIATTKPIGMYFELTYDGDENRWYFDAYRKVENREIDDGLHEQPNQSAHQ